MNKTDLIKRTIQLCADIIDKGLTVEETLYGHEALSKLAENPRSVRDHINDKSNILPDPPDVINIDFS